MLHASGTRILTSRVYADSCGYLGPLPTTQLVHTAAKCQVSPPKCNQAHCALCPRLGGKVNPDSSHIAMTLPSQSAADGRTPRVLPGCKMYLGQHQVGELPSLNHHMCRGTRCSTSILLIGDLNLDWVQRAKVVTGLRKTIGGTPRRQKTGKWVAEDEGKWLEIGSRIAEVLLPKHKFKDDILKCIMAATKHQTAIAGLGEQALSDNYTGHRLRKLTMPPLRPVLSVSGSYLNAASIHSTSFPSPHR